MASGLSARFRTLGPTAPARPARAPPRPILNHARDIKPHAHAVASSPPPAPSQPLPDAHPPRSSSSFESFEQFYSNADQQQHLQQEVLLLTPLARQLSTARDADSKVCGDAASRERRQLHACAPWDADGPCCTSQLRIIKSHPRFQAFASSPRCGVGAWRHLQRHLSAATCHIPPGHLGAAGRLPRRHARSQPGDPPAAGGRPSRRPCSSWAQRRRAWS